MSHPGDVRLAVTLKSMLHGSVQLRVAYRVMGKPSVGCGRLHVPTHLGARIVAALRSGDLPVEVAGSLHHQRKEFADAL